MWLHLKDERLPCAPTGEATSPGLSAAGPVTLNRNAQVHYFYTVPSFSQEQTCFSRPEEALSGVLTTRSWHPSGSFSDCCEFKLNHVTKGCLGVTATYADPTDLGWDLRIRLPSKIPCDAGGAGLKPSLWEPPAQGSTADLGLNNCCSRSSQLCVCRDGRAFWGVYGVSISVWLYACLCVWVYVCVCLCMWTWIGYIYMSLRVCLEWFSMCVYVCLCMSMCLNLCVWICVCLCVSVSVCLCICGWVICCVCFCVCVCVCVHCPLFNLPTGSLRAASSEYSETILVCLSNQQILEGETWFSGKDLSFQDAWKVGTHCLELLKIEKIH